MIGAIRSEFESAFRRMGSNPSLQEQLSHIMDGVVGRTYNIHISNRFIFPSYSNRPIRSSEGGHGRPRLLNRTESECRAGADQGRGTVCHRA